MSDSTKAPASAGYSSAALPTFSKTTIFVSLALFIAMGIFHYFNVQSYAETLSDTAYNVTYICRHLVLDRRRDHHLLGGLRLRPR